MRKVLTTCTRDCWDACALMAYVEGEKVVRLEGVPGEIYQGFICPKTRRFPERVYSPERVLHPLAKKDSQWKRISWDEALELTAEKLSFFLQKYGSHSLLYYQSGGSLGLLKILNRRFFALLGGVTFPQGDLCNTAGIAGRANDFGNTPFDSNDPVDLLHSKAILLWGKNPAATSLHLTSLLEKARRQGTRVWLIDPLHTESARLAERHIQPHPGSDGYLALGMAKLLLEKGWTDRDFLEKNTQGFAAFQQLVEVISLEEISRRCDLPLQDIQELTEFYAANKPAAIILGVGAQHYINGAENFRFIDALGAISGNIGVSGGGVNYVFNGWAVFDRLVLRKDIPAFRHRYFSAGLLGNAIQEMQDPPVKIAWIATSNPVNQGPHSRKTQEALASLEFCVIVDQFLTDTAQYAHLFLPCTTFLEEEDLRPSWGHNWISPVNPVIPPQGEAKSDLEILQLLSQRLGYGEAMAGSPSDWLRRLCGPLEAQGITLEKLKQGPLHIPQAPMVAFADRRFFTSSGKFEFITSPLQDEEEDPEFPLHLLSIKSRDWLHSQVPEREHEGLPRAYLHPDVAQKQGVAQGEEARLVSPCGSLQVRVYLDKEQRKDAVKVYQGKWLKYGWGINILTRDIISHQGNCPAYYDTQVKVEKAAE